MIDEAQRTVVQEGLKAILTQLSLLADKASELRRDIEDIIKLVRALAHACGVSLELEGGEEPPRARGGAEGGQG